MRFDIHNPSWLFGSDPYRMFEELKHKARWAEQHDFTWFSVMDHLIQIPTVGQPEEPFMEGWTVLSALAAVTERIRLATLVTSVAYRNPALLAKMAAGVDIIGSGRLTFGFGWVCLPNFAAMRSRSRKPPISSVNISRPARSCSLPVSSATIGRVWNCWRARSCRTLTFERA